MTNLEITFIIIICVLAFICLGYWSANDDYEKEIKELNEKLNSQISSKKVIESNKDRNELLNINLRITHLYGQGYNVHISKENYGRTIFTGDVARIKDIIFENLEGFISLDNKNSAYSHWGFSSKDISEVFNKSQKMKDPFSTKLVQEKLNKECSLKKEGEISSSKKLFLERYKNKEDTIFAYQLKMDFLGDFLELVHNELDMLISKIDVSEGFILFRYKDEKVCFEIHDRQYLVLKNNLISILNKDEFRNLYELERC